MTTKLMPPVIQAVGLACVPVADMPPATTLARKPVAAAIVTLTERDDGHRDVVIKTVTDARDMEHPLPVLINDALVAGAPTIITQADRDVIMAETASRRFFVEPALGSLAKNLIDPVAMFGAEHEEAALCRRLGIPANVVPDSDVARWWNREAPMAVEGVALTIAVSRMMLWAHAASFMEGRPDPFFENLLPLRLRLFELEEQYPGIKALLASRPFHRAASFVSYYRDYRAKRDAGDDSRWLTFEDGQSYV